MYPGIKSHYQLQFVQSLESNQRPVSDKAQNSKKVASSLDSVTMRNYDRESDNRT